MDIAWAASTVEMFGSVREMLEVSNALCRLGHRVTVYHPRGGPCVWLPTALRFASLDDLAAAAPDVLIGLLDWQPRLYEAWCRAQARVKAVAIMGLRPEPEVLAALRGEAAGTPDLAMIRAIIQSGTLLLPDSNWQVDWLRRELGLDVGPSIGGVNTAMFRPAPRRHGPPWRILSSGDPRPRKGRDTVRAALEIVAKAEPEARAETYWGRGLGREDLAAVVAQARVFVDGHRRGGWCNPVVEAMACGVACVCTRIGATADFALDGETALVVPVDDPEAMARAVLRLLRDNSLRERIAAAGHAFVQRFSYDVIGARLEAALIARLAKWS